MSGARDKSIGHTHTFLHCEEENMHLLDTTHSDAETAASQRSLHAFSFGGIMVKDMSVRRSLRASLLAFGIFVAAILTATVVVLRNHGPVSRNVDWDTAVGSTMLLEVMPNQRTYEEVFLLRPNWINLLQHGGNRSTDHVQRGIPEEQTIAQPRQLARAICKQRLVRFDQLAMHPLTAGIRDRDFPAAESSIAEPRANCGDSARHIYEPCSKFNKWETFQIVSAQMGQAFEVIDKKGVHWHDIGQGQLGNCYFLGALASLAFTDHTVIKHMFVREEKWSQNIFTTKWLVNGKTSYVEVDNYVPASNGKTFFVAPSSHGEWWPVILEKAWSKIFGSYKATEGGLWANPVMAMTRAPIDRYEHKKFNQDQVFQKMAEASKKKWPMGVASSRRAQKYGLAASHTYAVFKTHVMPSYGKVVTVYNPWHHDNYRGVIPHKGEHAGLFDMSLAEFYDAFDQVEVARVHKDYVDTSQLIQKENSKVTSWEFIVPFSGDFFVSVNWPSDRSVAPCEMLKPKVILAVTKQGSKEPILGSSPVMQVSSIFAGPIRGRGSYVATVSAEFPSTDYVHEVQLVVYAPKRVAIVPNVGDAADALMKAFGPQNQFGSACHLIHMTSRGTFELKKEKVVNGLPTYWSIDGAEFAYWFPQDSLWMVVAANMFARIKGGESWSNHKAKMSDLSCGCKDSANGVGGFNGVSCRAVSGRAATYHNVKCQGVQHSPLVQRYCPTACGATVCGAKLGPSPSPGPKAEIRQHCIDAKRTGLSVNGREARCDDLRNYCHQNPSVQQACCATCADRAEHGEVGNGKCSDEPDPYPGYTCKDLADDCGRFSTMQERCCATCKTANAGSLQSKCVDADPPNIRDWFWRKQTCAWAKRQRKCTNKKVKRECCKTCSA